MFIGHFAVGLTGRTATRRPSLGTWFLAVQWLDLVWPLLLMLGLEHVRIDPGNTPVTPLDFYDYPITHSLLTVFGWSIAFGGVYFVVRRDRTAASLLGLGVASHWLLDVATHRPDLPLWPGGPLVGFYLWRSIPATVAVETAMFAAGIWLYLRTTRARDRVGHYALWSLVVFLYVAYLANLFGPPPPSQDALAFGALAAWLFVPWAYWIDRHRTRRRARRPREESRSDDVHDRGRRHDAGADSARAREVAQGPARRLVARPADTAGLEPVRRARPPDPRRGNRLDPPHADYSRAR